MRTLHAGLLLLLAVPLGIPAAHAKDLRKRFGMGFNNQFGDEAAGFPCLSLRYGFPTGDEVINLQLEALAGFRAGGADGATQGFFSGGRLLYSVVAEDNLNVYLAAGAGWKALQDGSGLLLHPGLGVQFFFFGLENLGFSAEWGVAIDLSSTAGVATYTSAPGVGLHYYF